MKWSGSVILICILSSVGWSHADDFWKSLNSDFIQIELTYKNNPLVQSRYPNTLRFLLEGLWGWQPGTSWDMGSTCDLKEFKTNLINEQNISKKVSVLDNFLKQCSPVYSKNNSFSALKAIAQRGTLNNHPFFKYSYLNFPSGLKTRAVWGIKKQTRRDLVILRPGIFTAVDELIAERYLVYLLAELNNFHIVILENSTSGDQFVNNQQGIIGGPKEAFENLYLIEQIKKHPVLSSLVGKIHLMGVSLGANGVMLASLVNKKNGYKYFDKTVLMCPVIDLPGSFAVQMQNGFFSYALDWWGSQRFKDIASKNDFELAPFVSSTLSLSPRWIKGVWSWFEKKYTYQSIWQKYLSNEYYVGDFKKDYNFFNDETVLPDNLFVLSTVTDPIVHSNLNYNKLLLKQNKNTFFYQFPYGYHCSFSYSYDWKFLDQFLAGLLQSDEAVSAVPVQKFPIELVSGGGDLFDKSSKVEIRTIDISKITEDGVELIVYLRTGSHLKTGRVKVPLIFFELGKDYAQYAQVAVRNYIMRLLQTKAEVEFEDHQFLLKFDL